MAEHHCTPYSETQRRCQPPPSDWPGVPPVGWAGEESVLIGQEIGLVRYEGKFKLNVECVCVACSYPARRVGKCV